MKKFVSIFLLCQFLLLLLSACTPPDFYNQPSMQLFSQWSTKDGKLEIRVLELGYSTGTIETNLGLMEVMFNERVGEERMFVFSIDGYDEVNASQYLECWRVDYGRPDRFKVEVIESTYFTPGEKFTVYRTVKGITHKDYLKFCKKNPEANLSYGEYCEQYSAGE